MSKNQWDELDNSFDRGPTHFAWKAAGVIAVISLIGIGTCHFLNYANDAASTVTNELAPSTLLAKYTWLKEAHAQLDKKQADIRVMQASLDSLTSQYQGVPRNKWARTDLDTWAQKSDELAGTKMSYNQLAAEYNAKMAEIQYRFCNVGTLPQGATEPLPREYAPYTEN